MDSVFSSILIILAILFITFILSLLLRFLHLRINHRRLLSNSTPSRQPQPPPPLTTIVTESPPASVTINSLPPFHFTSDSTPMPSQPPPPAPEIQRAIDSLPTFHFSSISTTATAADCAVCLTEFGTTDLLRALPRCCHAFHSDCIDNWLCSSNLSCCPLCRSTIFASESDLAAILRSPSDSFRVEIGNVSRRESNQEVAAVTGDALSLYSIGGSFDYRVMEASQIPVSAVSSRTGSFRSFRGSGRFFGGSSNRIEVGEEITEMFRWISGDY